MSMLKPYEGILRKWDTKKYGNRPTVKQLKEINEAGLARAGSKTAFALAMLMREDGASQVQIKNALGATYRNRANQLCMLGLARLRQKRDNGLTHYRLEVKNYSKLRETVNEHEQHAAA